MSDTEIVDWLEKNLKEGDLLNVTASAAWGQENVGWNHICLEWDGDRNETEAPTLREAVKKAIEEQDSE